MLRQEKDGLSRQLTTLKDSLEQKNNEITLLTQTVDSVQTRLSNLQQQKDKAVGNKQQPQQNLFLLVLVVVYLLFLSPSCSLFWRLSLHTPASPCSYTLSAPLSLSLSLSLSPSLVG